MYSVYGKTCDSESSWSFDNVIASNVMIFGVDNSSSPHDDNCMNNFSVLGLIPTFGINGKFLFIREKV